MTLIESVPHECGGNRYHGVRGRPIGSCLIGYARGMADPASRESTPTPEEQVRRLYEGAETQTAKAMEQLVGSQGFGELLARMTENLVALTKVGSDAGDLVLRNLRIAGRSDITRLARQLNRTEDKLELLLQRTEELHDRLDEEKTERATNGAARPARAAPHKS
jgi:hypothetical protein